MSRIQEDIEFLAGRLPHRGANTENERVAAEYVCDRLREYVPDATLDDFYSINQFYQLAALYYFDFLFVALFAVWSPWAGVGYGGALFVMYMAETSGLPLMGRLLPQYETQNVVGRILGKRPQWNLVIVANYDSPKATYLTDPVRAQRLPLWHLAMVFSMVLVFISCIAEGMGVMGETGREAAGWARWAGCTALVGGAFVLMICENNGEYTRGANTNASGVAALLRLAERFAERPLDSADVTLLATGAKEVWNGGMLHFLRTSDCGRSDTVILNLDGVGGPRLCYTSGEGLLHTFGAGKELLRSGKACAPQFDAQSIRYRNLPTDGTIAMAKGYQAMTITTLGEGKLPDHWKWVSDSVFDVDMQCVERAVDFAEAVLRDIERSRGDNA